MLSLVTQGASDLDSIARLLPGKKGIEKVQALKTDLGLDDSVPNDVVRRLEMFTIGSVDPAIDHETAVKFCTHFPVEFFSLTNRITVLTGKGAEVKKKQQSSGEASK